MTDNKDNDNDPKDGTRVVASSSSSSSSSSSYENSDSSSKGIVSSLTSIVNLIMGGGEGEKTTAQGEEHEYYDTLEDSGTITSGFTSSKLCTTPTQLMDKIRDDYTINNYLWTGNIYLPAFEPNCQFTDPTLSFVGRDTFVRNVQNLIPIVDLLTTDNDVCKSDLLDIQLNEEKGYIESRWNMVGQLSVLPWKPSIDVIGRTKFWYRHVQVVGKKKKNILSSSSDQEEEDDDEEEEDDDDSAAVSSALRVYYYDETWEMPAFRALLQLITPSGTVKP